MKRFLNFTLPLLPALLIASMLCLPASAGLNEDIGAVLRDKALARAEVGIEILRLSSDPKATQVLFRHNSEIPLIPASNLKLATTSAALDTFGPDFKFRTLLLQHNKDLVLIGDGDPTLGDSELLRKSGWDSTTLFKNWAKQLKAKGLVHFDRLVVDDSVFDQQFFHPSWPAEQFQKHYCAQVGGLNLNTNRIDFYIRPTTSGELVQYAMDPPTRYATVRNTCITAGDQLIGLARHDGTNTILLSGRARGGDVSYGVTIHDPALFTATTLAETFAAGGITFKTAAPARDRTLRAGLIKNGVDEKSGWTVLAILETPMATVLARANKDSINLYAEALCKRLGAEASGESGSWKNGTAAVGKFLTKIGVDSSEFRLDDGCGLSRENVISANALCRVLEHNFHSSSKEAFMTSLAIAGKDGTLEHRFPGAMSDLHGRVLGKSGFVNQVRTLSGYLKAKDEQWYAFSILMNQMPDTATGKNLQEIIVRAIDAQSR